jgi:glycerophosphoryl diester phosphodiesterase
MVQRPLLAVAHRAGNSVVDLRAALDAGVDLVEADVHRWRRALEMRHWKAVGPGVLWDGGVFAWRRDVVVPELAEVLAVLGSDPRLMLDLKGVHPLLAPAVAARLRAVAPGVPLTLCTQHWWMFRAFADDPHLRLVPSAGSRRGLRRLLRSLRTSGASASITAFGVSVRRDLLTPAVVDELHASVRQVLTWPVDDTAALADARRLGVGGVISKSLPLLRQVIEER